MRRTKVGVLWVGLLVVAPAAFTNAQPSASDDAIIRPIQRLQTISDGDQGRIGRWVRNRVQELAVAATAGEPLAFQQFRDRIGTLYQDAGNTQAFKTALAVQVTQIATEKFADGELDATVGRGLARALVDMDVLETFAGLIAGLKTKDRSTRYLASKGLAGLRSEIARERATLDQAVAALGEAGRAETDAAVLGQVYIALSYADQVEAVFETFMAIFDKRLEYRRGPAELVDRAEVDAFEYFRLGSVLNALSGEQKEALAARLAVFLRLDAERYSAEEIGRDELAREREYLERRLDSMEACLEAIAGTGEGDIRGELRAGGHERGAAVLQHAYRWIGHPTTQRPGTLNEAPWNVPVGAP